MRKNSQIEAFFLKSSYIYTINYLERYYISIVDKYFIMFFQEAYWPKINF